jgi:hypothetical protein
VSWPRLRRSGEQQLDGPDVAAPRLGLEQLDELSLAQWPRRDYSRPIGLECETRERRPFELSPTLTPPAFDCPPPDSGLLSSLSERPPAANTALASVTALKQDLTVSHCRHRRRLFLAAAVLACEPPARPASDLDGSDRDPAAPARGPSCLAFGTGKA